MKMTLEEIQKRKKEIDEEVNKIHEEEKILQDKIHTLHVEYWDLEDKELELDGFNFEEGKYYICFGEMNYHYNVFKLLYIKSGSKKHGFSFIESVFRLDDYDPSYKVEDKTMTYKKFLEGYREYEEISSTDALALMLLANGLDWEKIEEFVKNYKKRDKNELQ